MHNIHMAEFTEEFSDCWNAAGSHIQRIAGGDLMSWLKANLAPPFLEHLSFRLGNQLFFIQLVDEDGLLETRVARTALGRLQRVATGMHA